MAFYVMHINKSTYGFKFESMISLNTSDGASLVKGPISVVLTLMLSRRHLSTSLELNGLRGGRPGCY